MSEESPTTEPKAVLPAPAFGYPEAGQDLWEAFAKAISPEFADSWLYGDRVFPGGRLMSRTETGYRRLRDTGLAVEILTERGLTLERPLPFHLSGQQSAYDRFNLPRTK